MDHNSKSKSKDMYTNKEFLVRDQERSFGPNQHFGEFINIQITFNSSGETARSSPGTRVNLSPANRVDIKMLIKNTGTPISGKYFLCRCITPADKMTSIMTVVDDPEGIQAVRLALYDYVAAESNLENILPVGLVLAIQHPWFKQTMDGGFMVRCNEPNDVVVITPETYNTLFPDLKWNGEIPQRYRTRAVRYSDIATKK